MSATIETHVRKGITSLGWTSTSQFVCLSIRFGSTLLLTRLLAPEIYGLFGTALALITLLEWISDFGVMPSLVRHPKGGTYDYLNTGWWISVSRGSTLTLICCAAAWPLAALNRQPALFPVLLALSLRSVIVAARSPAFPMLRRELKYRSLFFDEVVQITTSTLVTVVLAYNFRSVWSFVGGTLAGVLAGLVMSYVLFPARPSFRWCREAAEDLSKTGRQIYFNTLVAAFWMNFDRLLGLRYLSIEKMGNYTVALNLAVVLDTLVVRSCDVYFAMLSRQVDPEARARWHAQVLRKVINYVMPLLALGVAMAPNAVKLLYDPRYAEARVLFAYLVARAMIRGVGQLQFQYLLARGQIRSNTFAHGVALVVQSVLFIPFIRLWDVRGLAIANLTASIAYATAQMVFLRMKGEGSYYPLFATLAWMSIGLFAMRLIS